VNLGNFVREKLRLGAEIRRNRHPITCSPQNDVVVIGGRNRRENKISGDKISGETKGRRMASPEDEQALDAMNLEERRAHALRHGFVLDDSVADPDLLAQDGFPWEHVEASRRNRRLQKKHPMTDGWSRYLADAKACPKCQAPADSLSWFYFESPRWTWENLCGSAGWMLVCDNCKRQVDYFEEAMN
jgi:hypothetical protein